MREIGTKLKQKRESLGINIQEVASDLKLRVSQVENIEAGEIKAFKDVFYLKCFIKDYAKYLSLDAEAMIDDFNEYFFNATSKIPLDEIEKANKLNLKEKQKEKKIVSPYTLEIEEKSKMKSYIIIGIIIILIISIILLLSINVLSYVRK